MLQKAWKPARCYNFGHTIAKNTIAVTTVLVCPEMFWYWKRGWTRQPGRHQLAYQGALFALKTYLDHHWSHSYSRRTHWTMTSNHEDLRWLGSWYHLDSFGEDQPLWLRINISTHVTFCVPCLWHQFYPPSCVIPQLSLLFPLILANLARRTAWRWKIRGLYLPKRRTGASMTR